MTARGIQTRKSPGGPDRLTMPQNWTVGDGNRNAELIRLAVTGPIELRGTSRNVR